MPPVGETLREARMRQGLDIVDVESQTKIRAKYLRALENEEWGLLPGPTFVRTFLRTYAEAVGLDGHVLVEAYRVAADDMAEPEPTAPTAPRAPRAPRRDRPRGRRPGPPSPLALVGAAVAAVLVLLLALGLFGGSDSPTGGGGAVKSTTTRTAKAKAPARKPAPAGVTIRIVPTVPTYACLDSGDGTDRVFEGTLSQARTFRNAKQLRVNLGKRSVKLTANGKPVTVAQTAEPYGLQVTRDAAREITNGPRPCA